MNRTILHPLSKNSWSTLLLTLWFSLGNPSPLLANEDPYETSFRHSNSEFLAGYLQGQLDLYYPNMSIKIAVENNKVIVFNYPSDPALCEDIFNFLKEQPSVTSIEFELEYLPLTKQKTKLEAEHKDGGYWFPELTNYFPTLLGDPRIIGYSAGYRTRDHVFDTPLIPVSMGDRFSIYSYNAHCGHFHFGIEAAVWAVFEAKTNSLALLNADYFVGFPLAYFYRNFSARLRLYHQSSHLGDELLLEKDPYIHRLNPSMEVVDLFAAYAFNPSFLLFGGVGYVVRSDDSYKVKPWSLQYGFNYEIKKLMVCVSNLEAYPYLGVYFANLQNDKWHLDTTVAIGYQADKSYGHKVRLCLEGHDGYSLEGQFSKKRNRYLEMKIIFGY